MEVEYKENINKKETTKEKFLLMRSRLWMTRRLLVNHVKV